MPSNIIDVLPLASGLPTSTVTVIREGETNRSLHVVVAGKLEACLPENDTRFTKITLAEMGPGSCVGEYSFVDGKPTSAAVVAVADTVVFTLPLDDFERVSAQNHHIGMVIYRNLLTVLIDRLRDDNAMLDMIRPQR